MTESDKVKNALTNLTEKVKTDDYGDEYLDVDCIICELRKIGIIRGCKYCGGLRR